MNSFSPSSNQSSGITKLEKSLADAQLKMNNNFVQQPNICPSPIPKNNVSIPSDPSSLSSSIEKNHESKNDFINTKFKNQREMIIQLQTQINSFISFINAECCQNFDSLDSCAKFISQYFKSATQMKQMQDLYVSEKVENESLNSQIVSLRNDYKSEHKKTKKLMTLLKQLREYSKQQDSQIVCQSSKINELNLKLSRQNSTQVEFPLKNISIETSFPITQIENLLKRQSDEIQLLSKQRNLLLKNYQILDRLYNSKLISSINSLKSSEPKNNEIIPKTKTKTFNQCFTQTDHFLTQFTNQNQNGIYYVQENSNNISNNERRQVNDHSEELLGTVFSILQSIAVSTPNGSSKKDELITEIARINRYLDDHSITVKRPDINFLNIINDNELTNSPLYDIFVCIVNILNIMINIESQAAKPLVVEDSELKLANVELKTELGKLQKQLCEILKCKPPQILSRISEIVKKEKKYKKQVKETQNQAKFLTVETQKLEKEVITNRNNQLKDKKHFTQAATKILDDISDSIQKQTEEYERQISNLGKRLDEAKSNVIKLKEQTQQEKLNHKKIIEDKNKLIKQKNDELQKFNTMKQIELREKDELISRLNNKIDTLHTKYSDEKTQNKDFQEELNALNQERDTIFLALNTQNQKLAQEIEKLKIEKDNEIQSLTDSMKEKVCQFELTNEKILRENSKEKAVSQTYKMKLEEATRQIQLEKNHFIAKISTISLNAQNSIESYKEQFMTILNKICQKLNLKNNYSNESDFNQIENFVPQIYHKIDQLSGNNFILDDAIMARNRLNLSSDESIVDVIAKYENQLILQEKQNSHQNEQNGSKMRKLELKLESAENATKRANEWRFWSSSILKNIKGNYDPNMPEMLARKEIEEVVWISLREKASLQRIELLKRQKFILKNYAEFLDPLAKWNYKVKSVRPLALVIIFSKRLMKMSGTMPLQMALRDQNL